MFLATTRLIVLHVGKGGSVASALGRSTDYVKNPDKTASGEWVTSYECDPLTADAEFLSFSVCCPQDFRPTLP
jgi:hypothetical protein